MSYCWKCGSLLIGKELEHEGIVPFCPSCNEYCFPMYNVAVSMIVANEENGKLLLIRQYGKDFFRLVAGYVNRTESLEHAVIRELKEETGLEAVRIRFNRTGFFEPSNTLMFNFTAFVKDDSKMNPNYEIDSYEWFSPQEAKKNINPEILAGKFLNAYLEDVQKQGSEALEP